MDADDAAITPGSLSGVTSAVAELEGGKLNAVQKRQLGRLRAQGIDIRVPMTEGERARRTEHQRERKKRRRDEKKAASTGQTAGEKTMEA